MPRAVRAAVAPAASISNPWERRLVSTPDSSLGPVFGFIERACIAAQFELDNARLSGLNA